MAQRKNFFVYNFYWDIVQPWIETRLSLPEIYVEPKVHWNSDICFLKVKQNIK